MGFVSPLRSAAKDARFDDDLLSRGGGGCGGKFIYFSF
jgi:hypothetical protein